MNGLEDKNDVECFFVFSEAFNCYDAKIYDKALVSCGWDNRIDAEKCIQQFSETEYYYKNGIIFSKKILDEYNINPRCQISILKNKYHGNLA